MRTHKFEIRIYIPVRIQLPWNTEGFKYDDPIQFLPEKFLSTVGKNYKRMINNEKKYNGIQYNSLQSELC